MLVLAFDTASCACSAALAENGRVLAQAKETAAYRAEHLPGLLTALLRQAGKKFGDIDRIGVNAGPGSFTGARAGVAAARALALALEKPAFGFSGFAALREEARQKYGKGAVFAVIKSARQQIYGQYFPAAGAPLPPQIYPESAAAAFAAEILRQGPLCLAGSAAAELGAALPPAANRAQLMAVPAPNITVLAALTAQAAPESAPPAPLYLRPPDAKPQPAFCPGAVKSQFRAPPKHKKPQSRHEKP